MKYTIVERPRPYYDTGQIITTAGTETAVVVQLNGKTVHLVQSILRTRLRRQGYRLFYRKDSDSLICWAEKLTP